MYRPVVRHKFDGTVAVLAWELSSLCIRYISYYSTLSRKKQFFSKAATFSVLICVLADIRCQRLRVRHVRIVRLLCLFGSGMARAPPPLLALKKQVNGGSIMI